MRSVTQVWSLCKVSWPTSYFRWMYVAYNFRHLDSTFTKPSEIDLAYWGRRTGCLLPVPDQYTIDKCIVSGGSWCGRFWRVARVKQCHFVSISHMVHYTITITCAKFTASVLSISFMAIVYRFWHQNSTFTKLSRYGSWIVMMVYRVCGTNSRPLKYLQGPCE